MVRGGPYVALIAGQWASPFSLMKKGPKNQEQNDTLGKRPTPAAVLFRPALLLLHSIIVAGVQLLLLGVLIIRIAATSQKA